MSGERDQVRDDAVDRAWNEQMRETPPAALDDAIRAAARRAVGAKPRETPHVAEAREPWRWWMPLAAAATIGAVAIGVLQNMPQDAQEPTVVSDAVTAQRAPSVPASPPVSEDSPAKPADNALVAGTPKTAADAAPAPTPEQRDRSPLPMPRTEAPRAQPPAARQSERAPQDAAKPDAEPRRADRPAEKKETFVAPPPNDDRPIETRPAEPAVAALEKRAQDRPDPARRSESDASGFAASPPAFPPASPPPVVTAAPSPQRAAATASAPAAAAGALGGARDSTDAIDALGRAKLRAAAPERVAPAPAQAAAGARAMAEPQPMAVTPPDVFIAEIRRLLAAGDREGAARELNRFRRTHVDADARLLADLKAFGAGVPR
ncbi:MAG: hypothetical protein ABI585_14385 [Betaproteobacteria bacterium]